MANGNGPGARHTPVYYPELDETRVEKHRGVSERGLYTDPRPPETLASIYDARGGIVLGCSDQNTLNDLEDAVDSLEQVPNPDDPGRPTILFDRHTIRRLAIVGGYLATFQNRTPCLLRLAVLLDRSLSRYAYGKFRREFFLLLENLIAIRNEIAQRTQKRYRTFASLRDNPPLDPRVLLIDPLPQYPYWQSLLDLRSGRSIVSDRIPIKEAQAGVEDKQAWEQALDEIAQSLAEMRVQLRMRAAARGDTPTINRYLENLRQLTYADIERQTHARFPRALHGEPVAGRVELIFYNSVYSVILDGYGNPMRLPGIAPYALLLGTPRYPLIRHLQPPGLYLSVARLASYQFAVSGLKVRNLMLSGIIGLSRTEASFTFVHPLQEKLQEHLKLYGIKSIVAITVDEAFAPGELSIGAVRRTMPRLIAAMTRYALAEILARIRRLYGNYEELAEEVKDALLDVIQDEIEDWATEWVIKKVGKKVIPVVNVIAAIREVFDEEEHELVRTMVACVIMATRSRRPDDLAISAKVLAKIAAEKVEKAAIRKALKGGIKLARSKKPAAESEPAGAEPSPSRPDEPVVRDQPVAPAVPAEGAGQREGAAPPEPRSGVSREVRQEGLSPPRPQQFQQQQSRRTGSDPAVDANGTDATGVQDKATEGAGTTSTATPAGRKEGAEPEVVQLRPGVYRRRGKKPPEKAPAGKGEPAETADRGDDIAESHRALTQRGRIDDRAIDRDVHPAQSRPESVEAARQAGVPTEVLGDGYVMTRVDLPEAAPDRPVPRGKPAPAKKPTTGRRVSSSEIQNIEVRADLQLTQRQLEGSGARIVDVRIDQTQTTGESRAGTNRPDLQLTVLHAELNGRRIYIEYDRSPPTRALDHAERIIANEPDAIVILKIVDYEGRRRPQRPRRRDDDEPPSPPEE